MENSLIITAQVPWFDLFYSLAFLTVFGILLFEGYKRKIPMLKWIILIVAVRLMFITGTKIVTFSAQEWITLFTHFRLPAVSEKSLMGGILLGGFTLFAGFYLFGFRKNITDAFALAVPAGIAIQRLGCFFAGCCFGKPCSLPWAVQYPVNTLPHFHQFNDGLVSYPDFLSLPVHPVQLYETAGLLAVTAAVFIFRKKLKVPGNLALVSLAMVLAVRFAAEFFRDLHAHTIGGNMAGMLNITQLFLIPVMLLLLLLVAKREKQNTVIRTVERVNDFSIPEAFFVLLFLSLVFRGLKNWFVFPEMVVLMITLFTAFFVLGIHILWQIARNRKTWLYFAGFVLPIFLMAQTFPENTQDSVFVKKFKTIKFGAVTGTLENSHNIGMGEGCDRVSQTEYFKQKYTVAAAALEFTMEQPVARTEFTYGAKLMLGSHNETRISDNLEKNTFLFGVTPYATWESNWLGLGGGLHLGNLSFITENLRKEGSGRPESGSVYTPAYPQLYIRVGPRKWFFAEYRLADHFPSALPGFRQQLAMGTGLGLDNGTNLRLGFNTNDIYFVSGHFPIDNKIVLEPMVLWGTLYNYPDSPNKFFQYSFGVGYRFGHTEGNRK
jgi:prolipoprotein diacylglyceryltransferase